MTPKRQQNKIQQLYRPKQPQSANPSVLASSVLSLSKGHPSTHLRIHLFTHLRHHRLDSPIQKNQILKQYISIYAYTNIPLHKKTTQSMPAPKGLARQTLPD